MSERYIPVRKVHTCQNSTKEAKDQGTVSSNTLPKLVVQGAPGGLVKPTQLIKKDSDGSLPC